jgi:hypothetical protein
MRNAESISGQLRTHRSFGRMGMSKTISTLCTPNIIIHDATVNEIALLSAEIPQI